MPGNTLKVVGVLVRRPSPEAATSGGVQGWLDLAVEVQNQTNVPRHVWATYRSYDYDPKAKLLSLDLAERPLALASGIKLLSDHLPAPSQIEVAPNGRVKIRVRFPPHVRRAAPAGQAGWVEAPIGEIAAVDIRIQHAPSPSEAQRPHEPAADYRARLLAHGEVAEARITPTTAP